MEKIYRLFDWDKELFLYINSKHAAWIDPVMLTFSSMTSWVIVCAIVIAILLYRERQWGKTASIGLLITIGATAFVNNIVKTIVERPRPMHVEAWTDIIHAIEEYEASYSFFSGHSCNSFSMAVFSLLVLRNRAYSALILAWAAIVAYSRIYLGKHYPIDVICGIIFGVMMGIICYKLFEKYKEKRLGLKG